ncbi:Metalloenzyme, LuxS/M16 peptidase-like protein [Phyllosticta citribraziliensis]|uniref:Presequence protease, mitochondrial n=1 Tax=Phyllosticta citribraziliensis TaxID=989973 RepID=A0ABR1LA50_9PEZI
MLRASQPSTWAPRSLSLARWRSASTVTNLKHYPAVGERIHGFTLKRAKHFPELELTALHLNHDKTGAEYLHVARDDSNNVFTIGFKTNPPDDTGVPHILEHTTLCGSEKYPVRDPFFKMLPRSLSNFMNAFTSSDYTSYPFATINQQDFKNLMSVYLDATLRPLLKASDFTQEGWRIGPENPLEEASANNQLAFKGVVYNEMKGQMSDASYLYYIRFQDHIFPAINNSGGDPQKITDLTHEQLQKFHADHYHPSNAKIFTYGDFPVKDHLKEINAQLEKFDKIKVDTDIKVPVSLDKGPQNVTVKGPIDPLVPADMQYKTSTAWLVGETSDILETFSLGVLSSLLLDGYGCPLYRGLIETGLGPDWSPNTGYDTSGKIGIFSVGLNGVKKEDVPKVKEALFKTLNETREKGFPQEKIDGILHQLELSLKHKTASFGMGLMSRLKPGWFNGVDPFDSLAWNDTVEAFKREHAKGGYLERLMDKWLLNDNTLTFTMEPSESYAQELAAEEASRLASKILETTKQFGTEEEAKKFLEKRELDLLEEQNRGRNQDLSCLPTLRVKDISRRKEKKPVRDSALGNVKVQWREAATNGLTYFRAVNVLDKLPDELRQLIPLFSDAIMRLGTKNRTMEELEDLIKLKTGGIGVGYHSTTSPKAINDYEEGLVLSGYAFDRNVPAMYELLNTVIRETDFDGPESEKKIRQLLQASASGAVDAVASSGHGYARRFAEAGLTPGARLREQTAGLTQVQLTASLAARGDSESLADVISKLKTIQNLAVANTKNMRVALTCGTESSTTNEQALQKFLSTMPTNASETPAVSRLTTYPRNAKSFFPLPYQVYYSSLALPTVPYTDGKGPPLQILAQLLTHKHLHHEIREKGGAYGGGAYANGLGGTFGFYSYRDPNPQNTMRIVNESGVWARDREWTDGELEEAKLSVFQSVDAPESVSQEGMNRFLSGVDYEMQQKRREQLLDVSIQDVREAAQHFLVDGVAKSNVAVLGEKKDWVNKDWEVRDLGMAESS